MAFDWNIFRILADISHTSSKCILIWAIHVNQSAEGVSLITQLFYLGIFCARYLPPQLWQSYDIVTFHKVWNTSLKIFYVLSSAYILFLMTRIYARTRERERAGKMGAYCLLCCLVTSPIMMMIFKDKEFWTFAEFSWTFSIELESVCVLPQLLLLRQTTVPTVIDSFYLVTLGSYRGFYLINWFVRTIRGQGADPISIIFGLIQTALYVDFAWVYWTRQRVKLRSGAVVDSDDLSKGWLVKRIIGPRASYQDEEERPGFNDHQNGVNGTTNVGIHGAISGTRPRSGQKWGPRGISVSADDGVLETAQQDRIHEHLDDPMAFEDNDDEIEDDGPPNRGAVSANVSGISNGAEWRDNDKR